MGYAFSANEPGEQILPDGTGNSIPGDYIGGGSEGDENEDFVSYSIVATGTVYPYVPCTVTVTGDAESGTPAYTGKLTANVQPVQISRNGSGPVNYTCIVQKVDTARSSVIWEYAYGKEGVATAVSPYSTGRMMPEISAGQIEGDTDEVFSLKYTGASGVLTTCTGNLSALGASYRFYVTSDGSQWSEISPSVHASFSHGVLDGTFKVSSEMISGKTRLKLSVTYAGRTEDAYADIAAASDISIEWAQSLHVFSGSEEMKIIVLEQFDLGSVSATLRNGDETVTLSDIIETDAGQAPDFMTGWSYVDDAYLWTKHLRIKSNAPEGDYTLIFSCSAIEGETRTCRKTFHVSREVNGAVVLNTHITNVGRFVTAEARYFCDGFTFTRFPSSSADLGVYSNGMQITPYFASGDFSTGWTGTGEWSGEFSLDDAGNYLVDLNYGEATMDSQALLISAFSFADLANAINERNWGSTSYTGQEGVNALYQYATALPSQFHKEDANWTDPTTTDLNIYSSSDIPVPGDYDSETEWGTDTLRALHSMRSVVLTLRTLGGSGMNLAGKIRKTGNIYKKEGESEGQLRARCALAYETDAHTDDGYPSNCDLARFTGVQYATGFGYGYGRWVYGSIESMPSAPCSGTATVYISTVNAMTTFDAYGSGVPSSPGVFEKVTLQGGQKYTHTFEDTFPFPCSNEQRGFKCYINSSIRFRCNFQY